jgi:hypothetical protein
MRYCEKALAPPGVKGQNHLTWLVAGSGYDQGTHNLSLIQSVIITRVYHSILLHRKEYGAGNWVHSIIGELIEREGFHL